MFLLRSAFWLTMGFLIVAPHGTDFGATATTLRDEAVRAGTEAATRLVVSQVQSSAAILPAMLELTTNPAVTSPEKSPARPVVFPRARPAALG